MLMCSVCQHLPCVQHAPLRERMPLTVAAACANVYGGCIAMACRDTAVQPYQFDAKSDPDGEAPVEVQTQWLQQVISEWLVCLNNEPCIQLPLDTCPLRCSSDPILLHRPPSGNPHHLRFESAAAQYGRQLASRGRGVPAIITWSLMTAVIGLCY